MDRYRKLRRKELLRYDRRTEPHWYRAHDLTAYVLYADLFSPEATPGRYLQALREHVTYFEKLGVNLIHILPIFKSSGDGGFAIDDHLQIDEKYGTLSDFKELVDEFHKQERKPALRIALDFVLNHVSNNHPWAKAALESESGYHNYFIWDETGTGKPWPGIPDMNPGFASGHWDFVPELGKWIFATFYKRYPYDQNHSSEAFPFAQWDLNYANPAVLISQFEVLLGLANWGVDVLRLDATSFLWKTKGTCCMDLPQVHTILKIFRLGLLEVAPKLVFLVETNASKDEQSMYLKDDEAQISYHFPLMPALWQAVTIGGAEGIREALTNSPKTGQWWLFSECHDDLNLINVPIAIAGPMRDFFLAKIDEDDQSEPGKPRGVIFGTSTGTDELCVRGICGTTYSLLSHDIDRILLLWQLKLSLGWTPFFYMGEELGTENDWSYENDPYRSKDSRFIKRIGISKEQSEQQALFGTLSKLIREWRWRYPCLARAPNFFDTGNDAVLCYWKDGQPGILVLANCSEEVQKDFRAPSGTAISIPAELKRFEFWWAELKGAPGTPV